MANSALLRPVEQDYNASVKCPDCQSDFGLFLWKCVSRGDLEDLVLETHLCRACGYYFCGPCSPGRRKIPKFGYDSEQRVCNLCNIALALEADDASALNEVTPALLKRFAEQRNIDVRDCIEKSDIIARLRQRSAEQRSEAARRVIEQRQAEERRRQQERERMAQQLPNAPAMQSTYPTISGYPGMATSSSGYPGVRAPQMTQAPPYYMSTMNPHMNPYMMRPQYQAPPYYTTNAPGMVPPNMMATMPPGMIPPGMMSHNGMMPPQNPLSPFTTVRDVRAPPMPAEQFTDLDNMRVQELQQILQRYNISANDILEKKDLVRRVREVLAQKEKEANEIQEKLRKDRLEKEKREREEKERLVKELQNEKDGGGEASSTVQVSATGSEKDSTEEDADDPEKDMCVICLDSKIATVFLECGHMACCVGCSTKVVNCPICRRPITRVINVFHANK